jgi:type VI secretion system protein VasD
MDVGEMMKQVYIRLMPKGLIIFFLTLLAACSNIPRVPVWLSLDIGPRINTDESAISLPVRVKIYQLKDITAFKEASFRELWKMDKTILADSLVTTKSITVTPNLKKKLRIERMPDTKYIGVIVLFRRAELGKWRAYKKVDSQAKSLVTTMSLAISGNTVRIK